MRGGHLLAASLGAGVVLFVACGRDPRPSCGSYYDAVIATLDRCGTQTLSDPIAKSNYENYCEAVSNAPGVDSFADQIDKCTTAVQSATCDDIASQVTECGAGLAGACALDVHCKITGTRADGAACGNDAQCSSGYCAPKFSPSSAVIQCGTCAHYLNAGDWCDSGGVCDPQTSWCNGSHCIAYAQQGEDCALAECQPPFACDLQSHTCESLPTNGEACTYDCAEPYRCISQTCSDVVQQGGTCATDIECATYLACNLDTHTCEPQQLAGNGQACGMVGQSFVWCQADMKCDGDSFGGTCEALKQLGETCDLFNHCAQFLVCVSGTCQIPDFATCK